MIKCSFNGLLLFLKGNYKKQNLVRKPHKFNIFSFLKTYDNIRAANQRTIVLQFICCGRSFSTSYLRNLLDSKGSSIK